MNTFNFYIFVMVEVQKSIDDQLNLQEYVIKEISSELQELGKEAFYKEENGTKEVDISKVDAFLNTIKDQKWKALKDQKRDRLWITAVQMKLASLGYDLGSKKIDGWFGAKTREAVKQFQIAMNFPENQRDGLPGPQTIQALLTLQINKKQGKNSESSKTEIPETEKDKEKIDETKTKETWKDEEKNDETRQEFYAENINNKKVAEAIKAKIESLGKSTITLYGQEYELKISHPTKAAQYGVYEKYDSLQFQVEGANIIVPLNKLITKEKKFNATFWKDNILPEIQNSLEKTLSSFKIAKTLRWKKYSKVDLPFSYDPDDVVIHAAIDTYFSNFDNNEVLIADNVNATYGKEGNLYIELDDEYVNESYNSHKNNSELIIKTEEIANTEWELDEGKFKEKLAAIIENIVNKHFEIESS